MPQSRHFGALDLRGSWWRLDVQDGKKDKNAANGLAQRGLHRGSSQSPAEPAKNANAADERLWVAT